MNKLITLSLLCAVFIGVSVCAQKDDTYLYAQDTISYTTAQGTKYKTTNMYGKIEGSVIDGITSMPLTDVTINVLSDKWLKNHKKYSRPIKSIRVENDGNFRIDSLLGGRYCVQFAADDTTYNVTTFTNVNILRGLILTMNNKKLFRKAENDSCIDYAPMIDREETGTIRCWSKDEINKLPGH
jgi:hypothetical protein